MPLPAYANNGPVDCSVKPDTGTLKGKSVVVTGGEHWASTFIKAYQSGYSDWILDQVQTALARVMFAHSLPPGELSRP
jgi:hypothetical protein